MLFYIGTINKFKKKKIPNIEILINSENLKILEAQRKRLVDVDIPFYAKAKIKITEHENKTTELIKVKIRAKGDRAPTCCRTRRQYKIDRIYNKRRYS